MTERRFSLRRRIAVWLLPPLLVMLLVNAYLSYRAALEGVNRAYDRSLSASIKAIAEQTHSLEGEIQVDIPYAAFEVFEDRAQERVYHAVLAASGTLVTGYEDLLPPHPPPPSGEVMLFDSHFRGMAIRLGAMTKRLYDPALPSGDTVTIVFAETTESRTELARELFLDSVRRQLALLGLGGALVFIAIGTAFRPLLRLRTTFRKRSEEDLTPVEADEIPNEVAPLIDAINHHMERLSAMLDARRRFLADAAHQIRTPLAVLTTQAEVGLRQSSADEMRQTFASLLDSIRATRRLANQMLSMSHAEAINGSLEDQTPVDLSSIAREVALDLATLAVKKRIELVFDCDVRPLLVCGNLSMLREMIANLVDNAIRYGPTGSSVMLSVHGSNRDAVLNVIDQGPGIPECEREHVFKRFYRILGHGEAEGSGLGLAIVREICRAHGGRIALKAGENGLGLNVELTLPLAAHPAKGTQPARS